MGFDPWVRKIPQRRAWQPTPVFFPGESHGQRSLAGYSPWGHKELEMIQRLNNERTHTKSHIIFYLLLKGASQVAKNLLTNARDLRDAGSILGSGRSLRGGHSNPLQYSCLENSMDRGTWQAIVHRVAKRWTQLND